jgi:hypothetical protein
MSLWCQVNHDDVSFLDLLATKLTCFEIKADDEREHRPIDAQQFFYDRLNQAQIGFQARHQFWVRCWHVLKGGSPSRRSCIAIPTCDWSSLLKRCSGETPPRFVASSPTLSWNPMVFVIFPLLASIPLCPRKPGDW